MGLSGLTLSGIMALAACQPPSDLLPPAASAPTPFQAPPVVLEAIRFEGYRGSGREFEVRAERADVRMLDRVALLEDVEIEFEDTGRGSMQVRSKRAELDLVKDDFVLHDDVEGSTGNGERFETSEVAYDPRVRLLRTDESVRVERGTWSLQGVGMEIDVPGRRLRVLRPQTTRTGR